MPKTECHPIITADLSSIARLGLVCDDCGGSLVSSHADRFAVAAVSLGYGLPDLPRNLIDAHDGACWKAIADRAGLDRPTDGQRANVRDMLARARMAAAARHEAMRVAGV